MQLGDLTQYGMAAGASKRRIMTLFEGRCTNGRREGEPVELDRGQKARNQVTARYQMTSNP